MSKPTEVKRPATVEEQLAAMQRRILKLEADSKKTATLDKRVAQLEKTVATQEKMLKQGAVERANMQREIDLMRREFNRSAQSVNRHDGQITAIIKDLEKTVKRT